MNKPRSIISTAAARQALSELHFNGRGVAHVETAGVGLHLRRTKIGTLRVSLEWLACSRYQHATSTNVTRVLYVRSKNEVRRVSELFEQARRDATARTPLWDAREALYLLAESREVPESWFDNPPLPKPMDYDLMTEEDVRAWTPLVEALPLKAPAVA